MATKTIHVSPTAPKSPFVKKALEEKEAMKKHFAKGGKLADLREKNNVPA